MNALLNTIRGPAPHLKMWVTLFVGLIGVFISTAAAAAESPPLPGAKIVALDRHASEAGPDEGSFVVLRTGSTAENLTVFYSVDGTAEPGLDYQALPGFVTIPAGFASALITVNPIDDSEVEERETVVLEVIDPPGGATYVPCWPARARVAIEDDDNMANEPPAVKLIHPRDGAVFVGPESIALVAKASDPDGFVKSVEFFDGMTSLGVVTYPRLVATPELLGNPEQLEDAIADKLAELEEEQELEAADTVGNVADLDRLIRDRFVQFFRLRWKDIEPGEHILTALATDSDGESTLSEPIMITVKKGPIVPVVNVVAVDPIAAERGGLIPGAIVDDESSLDATIDPAKPDILRPNNAVFVIKRRAADISRPLHVFYRVEGTATNGEDYRRIPHHVTIPADAWAVRVTIRPFDDQLVEGRESVVIKLVPQISDDVLRDVPGYYRVGEHGKARAVILDNDGPIDNQAPHVRLVRPRNGAVFKAGSSITLVANAFDRDGHIKSVEFFEGDNSLGIVENPLPLLTAVGAVNALSVQDKTDIRHLPLYRIQWDDVPEGNYVLTAVATDNLGEQTISRPVEIRVVSENPGPVVTVVARDPVAAETSSATDVAENTATFVVARRGGAIDEPLTVYYRLGGEAENGVDYRELPYSITIAPGEYKALVTIVPIDDDECEGPEGVVIGLTAGMDTEVDAAHHDYRLGRPHKAIAVIRDNDVCDENHPPKVKVLLPLNGMVFQAPVNVPVYALAGDVDGEVTDVSVYAGDSLIGHAESIGPHGTRILYGLDWENAPAGDHELTVVVTDDDDATTRSEPVSITVLPEADSEVEVIPASETVVISDGAEISIADAAVASSLDPSAVIEDENGVTVQFQQAPVETEKLANISTRGQVKAGAKKMITGFVVAGTGTKNVLIRAVGPTLATYGLTGTLVDPVLELYAAGSTSPDEANDDWGQLNPASIRDAETRLGAFALGDGSADSALSLTLEPGSYTAQVGGADGGTGIGLLEVYDGDDPLAGPSTARVVNISTRGEVGTGDDVLIVGFVINGTLPRQVLIRAVGPTLESLGVSDAIADPELELLGALDQSPIAANANWEDDDGAAIAEAGVVTGAFPLESGSGDAALLIWLEPGSYTAKMSGQNGETGIGLVEVYEMP